MRTPDEMVEAIRTAQGEVEAANEAAEQARRLRDESILELWRVHGWSYAKIGGVVGLSTPRVQQIVGAGR